MARLFTATSDKVSFGDTPSFDAITKGTWAGWFYATSLADGIMWGKWGGSSSNQAFLIETKNSNSAFSFAVRDDFEVLLVKQGYNLLATHQWMHLAFVWSGANNLAIYKNGVSRTITNINNNSPVNVRTITAVETFGVPDTPASATLGAYEFWGAWKDALSAGEVGKLAQGADPATIRPAACLALPTFDRQGVVFDRRRQIVAKPTGTRPFTNPPIIMPRRRVAGTFAGTSPPPSNTNYLMPMLGVGDD